MTEVIKVSQALKPCPFCGASGHLLAVAYIRDGKEIACRKCKATGGPEFHGPNNDTEQRAITAWNTRHESQLPLLEALEEARDSFDAIDDASTDLSNFIGGMAYDAMKKIDTILASFRGEAS